MVWDLSSLLNVTPASLTFLSGVSSSPSCSYIFLLCHKIFFLTASPCLGFCGLTIPNAFSQYNLSVPKVPISSSQCPNLSSRRRESITLAQLISTCTGNITSWWPLWEGSHSWWILDRKSGWATRGWGLARSRTLCIPTDANLPGVLADSDDLLFPSRVTPFISVFVHLCIHSAVISWFSNSSKCWRCSNRENR